MVVYTINSSGKPAVPQINHNLEIKNIPNGKSRVYLHDTWDKGIARFNFLYKANEKQQKYAKNGVLNARQKWNSLHTCDDALIRGNACYD